MHSQCQYILSSENTAVTYLHGVLVNVHYKYMYMYMYIHVYMNTIMTVLQARMHAALFQLISVHVHVDCLGCAVFALP